MSEPIDKLSDTTTDTSNDTTNVISNDDKPYNYRYLNCVKARSQRTLNRMNRQQEDDERKQYITMKEALLKERKKQVELLKIRKIQKDIELLKKQINKEQDIIKPPIQQPPQQPHVQHPYYNVWNNR